MPLVTNEKIRALRQAVEHQASLAECRQALENNDGDFNRALEYLLSEPLGSTDELPHQQEWSEPAHATTTPETVGIAERVRFWEEQDRINQAIIPRVIRQSELLTKHVAEHDDLPQLVGRVIADALAEQAKQYDAVLAESIARLNDAHAQALQTTNAKYEAALEEAIAQLNSTHAQALQAANAEQEKRYESALACMHQEGRRTRNRLTIITAGAVAVAVAAVVIAVLV